MAILYLLPITRATRIEDLTIPPTIKYNIYEMTIADMGYDFSNKLVLMTGGTGALGRAVVEAFNASNAKSIATYITDREVENATAGKKISDLIKADITKEGQVIKLASDVVQKHSRIDVLVNVVGGYVGGKTVSELEANEWDKMMNLNLKSSFLISKHVIEI